MSEKTPKIEFIENGKTLEIRYFDTPEDHFYLGWRLPKSIVKELINFWLDLKENKRINFPLQKRNNLSEFTMYTDKFVEIKSLDSLGRTSMTGWSLPKVVIEELISWSTKKR